MNIAIINGPNLNLLGSRETEIYGSQSFETFLQELIFDYPSHNFQYFQSNIEGEIIDEIQARRKDSMGIILNPAAYTHTSVAIGDAIAAINVPVVEVHISNVFSRELFRQHSFVSAKAKAVISGMGLHGYRAAINFLSTLV